jgi:hypothetical protein
MGIIHIFPIAKYIVILNSLPCGDTMAKKTTSKKNIPEMAKDGCPTCGKPMKDDKTGKLAVCHTGHSFLKHRKKR